MKVATYHRVSTLDQDPAAARDELHEAAARLGGQVVLAIEETGSGARNDRPGLQRVMDAARRGGVDAVMVWKLDRFGRSALDVLANIHELEAVGARFIVTTQGLDVRPGGDAMSRLVLGVLAAVAEFERDLIRERTLLGLARARRDGKHVGRPRSRPSADAVRILRTNGFSWASIAKTLRCSTSGARRALIGSLAPGHLRTTPGK